ncbi:hypothetical protein BDZ45DRAFT_802086 [Acephala macrosclerotiorum]|nr:hypothetical protein BDZ45DRAFT_802086 [Acephala macrosclerotiorum]
MRPRTAASNSTLSTSNDYHSKQTRSGHGPASRLPLSSGLSTSSPKPPTFQRGSIRATHKISFNLVSLVTKFEALDALSLPFKPQSLQPAPLQVSPRLRRRGGGKATGHLKRLSTIFSSNRSGGDNEDPFFSEDEPYPGRENLFSSSNAKTSDSLNKQDIKKLRKVQSTRNGNSIRRWGRSSKNVQKSPASVVTAPYVKNEFPAKNKRSIRDMIKLYDGAISDGSITKGKPSTTGSLTPNTPTPISRRKPGDGRYHLSPSTGNSRPRFGPCQSEEIDSPTQLRQSPSKRSLLCESVTTNRFIGQNTPSKCSVNSLTGSPRTVDRARHDGEIRNTKQYCLPSRSRYGTNIGLGPHKTFVENSEVSSELERGRSLPRRDISATCDRRQISNKIELLYQAKSLERKQDYDQAHDSRTSILKRGGNSHKIGNAPADSDFGRYLRKKSSKVAVMTKIFDNGYAPKLVAISAPPPPSKPVFSAWPPFVERDLSSLERVFPLSRSSPHIPQAMAKRKSTISPKTALDFTIVQVKTDSPAKPETQAFSQPKSRQGKPSTPKGTSINEKVRLFESVRDGNESMLERKRSVFARKLSRSLKSLFEPPSSRRDENEKRAEHGRGLDESELRAIASEAQRSTDSLGRIGNRTNTLLGRWNTTPPAPVPRGGDGAVSEKGIGSTSAAEVQEMVVKEVECGLKEPKPVRVAEAKRMMLICKGRFGDMIG